MSWEYTCYKARCEASGREGVCIGNDDRKQAQACLFTRVNVLNRLHGGKR
jgi:hypothetical protein